jgi:CheY-like chemotaxis protein
LVIVADDDASVRDITKQTLEAYGYVARVAADGAEALALLIEERAKAKILFTDYAMPIMDGRQLISAVRKMGMTVKIIVASGTSMTDDERKGISAEADALLSKPFTAGRLLTTLYELLSQAE